jgi:hypothetical protein
MDRSSENLMVERKRALRDGMGAEKLPHFSFEAVGPEGTVP